MSIFSPPDPPPPTLADLTAQLLTDAATPPWPTRPTAPWHPAWPQVIADPHMPEGLFAISGGPCPTFFAPTTDGLVSFCLRDAVIAAAAKLGIHPDGPAECRHG